MAIKMESGSMMYSSKTAYGPWEGHAAKPSLGWQCMSAVCSEKHMAVARWMLSMPQSLKPSPPSLSISSFFIVIYLLKYKWTAVQTVTIRARAVIHHSTQQNPRSLVMYRGVDGHLPYYLIHIVLALIPGATSEYIAYCNIKPVRAL